METPSKELLYIYGFGGHDKKRDYMHSSQVKRFSDTLQLWLVDSTSVVNYNIL